MNKILVLLILLVINGYSIVQTEVSASALNGEWKITLNLRTRVWYDNGNIKSDEKNHYVNDFIFYPNGDFINEAQPNYEHGIWRKSGNKFWLYPDYSGPTIINGPNNSITVTNWVINGKKRRNAIKGNYLMQYTITVWDFFSGIVIVTNAEINGTFIGKKITEKKQASYKQPKVYPKTNGLIIQNIINKQIAAVIEKN